MGKWIIDQMRTFRLFRDRPVEMLVRQIKRGHEIKTGDERVLNEKGVLRSHYHLSDEDKEALATASQYDIMVEVRAEEGDDFFDEEE